MVRYRLSPDVVEGLKPLSTLPPDQFQEFLDSLERNLPVSLAFEEELEKFAAASPLLSSMPESERQATCEAITGAHYLKIGPGNSVEDFLKEFEDLWHAKGADTSFDALAANFQAVLRSKVLRASVKAWTLISDHDKLYLSSRIFTDIRPVFEEDIEEPLLASLVLHSLKLTVRIDGKPQSMYVAVDSEDLRELRDTIDRALKKADYLASRISGGGFGPALAPPGKD